MSDDTKVMTKVIVTVNSHYELFTFGGKAGIT